MEEVVVVKEEGTYVITSLGIEGVLEILATDGDDQLTNSERGKFGSEGGFLTWLVNDVGYDYEGI